MNANPLEIGVVAELASPLSFKSIANGNLMTMRVDDLNARAGLICRHAPYLACAAAPSAACRSTALRNAPSTVTAKL